MSHVHKVHHHPRVRKSDPLEQAENAKPYHDVTAEQLRQIMPSLSTEQAQAEIGPLNEAMRAAGVNTPQRQASFLAQVAQESTELQASDEGGNHARYHGRGPLQLTSRANYQAVSEALGLGDELVKNPDRVSDADIKWKVAAWYWSSRDLNRNADHGDFRGVTRGVNGAANGPKTHLADRERYYRVAQHELGVG